MQARYLVVNDYGRFGIAYEEVEEGNTTLDMVVRDLADGQYDNPVRVEAFNTLEGWARDVSAEVATLVLHSAMERGKALTINTSAFCARHVAGPCAMAA